MSALHRLAREAGLQIDWQDAAGKPQRVSDDSLRRVLNALGYPADDDQEIADSLERCRAPETFFSADCGDPLTVPETGGTDQAELVLEDGSRQSLTLERTEHGLRVAGIGTPGYHSLTVGGCEYQLAIAPARCFGVSDAAPGRKLWGTAAQVPSLRGSEPRAFGDFGSLAEAVRGFAATGADALAISPTHALFPANAARFSPYAPSSRLFLNILFGDPALVGHPLNEDAGPDLIDWENAIPARLAALRKAFAARSDGVRQAVAAYAKEGGTELERHAIFDALHAHFLDTGANGWQGWPEEYHDPAGEAVARFAAEHREEVDFFLFAQWLAKTSLDAAQRAATDAGMAVGLISDLAVGMDSGGSHGWSRPGDLLNGLSIGAPPDPLGPEGQDWGITGFSPSALRRTGFKPFIATLRAALDHAGGIRIDHALGLSRLWVIPHGCPSSEGAYLTYPLQDMLRVLAIESHRARAIVIGEDLGTVPQGLRPQLEARDLLGMRVLWFERKDDGDFRPPSQWDRQAVALTSTHDLPTVAGWWSGHDLDWNRKLGRTSEENAGEERSRRDWERGQLWHAFTVSGAAEGDRPAPDNTDPVADAALVHLGRTPSELAIVPLEDVVGLAEQPNLPGTTDQHPNWRRRMPESTSDLIARPNVARRLERLTDSRPRRQKPQ
ncbi:4-alpha-glucanotransferase [Altericroceibacterium xinjiangense]|uniref:4-alpha-glucanotransferase n=1 Tax=Altericroceibacterium xinjiangense TaxID=762261 RepID=UPI000F7E2CEF|nr:4-alpha-glucanotransferase [Altericroceibacterium xinjiangense]